MLLYPPPAAAAAGAAMLGGEPAGAAGGNTSAVDPLAVTPRQAAAGFPRAPAHDVILAPGCMLYIPPRWWHHVTSLSLSASVRCWWPPPA